MWERHLLEENPNILQVKSQLTWSPHTSQTWSVGKSKWEWAQVWPAGVQVLISPKGPMVLVWIESTWQEGDSKDRWAPPGEALVQRLCGGAEDESAGSQGDTADAGLGTLPLRITHRHDCQTGSGTNMRLGQGPVIYKCQVGPVAIYVDGAYTKDYVGF